MARVLLIEARERWRHFLAERLVVRPGVEFCRPVRRFDAEELERQAFDTVVYAPRPLSRRKGTLDLADAAEVFASCVRAGIARLVVLSSAAIYAPNPHNQGLMAESRLSCRHRKNRIARPWWELEELAKRHLGKTNARLIILRPADVPDPDTLGPLGRFFHRRLAFTLLGYDPSIQLLSLDDLAEAVCLAVEAEARGVYNIAPEGVIPLKQALQLAGVRRLSIPYLWHRTGQAILARLRIGLAADRSEYLRHSWTISGARSADELGFEPRHSSAAAVLACKPRRAARLPQKCRETVHRQFDDFGLDENYFAARRPLLTFMHRYYWRVEVKDVDLIPRHGPAVLVGVHRGFMPFDGALATHLIARAVGRIPRFLIHPGLVKFPFLHDFMVKQGGMIACNENADYVLQRGDLLALYPEGVQGAFRLYREAYQLGKFGRDEYVRMALRNQAPIVPFVTVGSAEIFPILGKLEWSWWKRYSEWPCFPLTPTFPLLPVPLPSKWHTQFLAPIHVERQYPPEAADDENIVRAIGQEVRGQMQQAMEWMLSRRRSIFYGCIFDEGTPVPVTPACEENVAPVNIG